MKTKFPRILVFSLSLFLLLFSVSIPMAAGVGVTVNFVSPPGEFSLQTPSAVSTEPLMPAGNYKVLSGRISGIEVRDYRGTLEGWGVQISASHLGIMGEYAKKRVIPSGNDSRTSSTDITVAGVYDGLNPHPDFYSTVHRDAGEFIVTVEAVAGTPAKPSKVLVRKPDGNETRINAGTDKTFRFNGLIVSFPGTDRPIIERDTFGITVDFFPYSEMTIASRNLASTNESPFTLEGMEMKAGSTLTSSGASSMARLDVSAGKLYGLGSWRYNDEFEWRIHGKPLPGKYQANITYTLH